VEKGSGAFLRLTLMVGAIVTVCCVVAVRLLDRRPVSQLGIVPGPGFWGDLAFGLGLGALLMTVVFGVERAAGWVRVVDVAGRGPGESFTAGFLRMTGGFLAVGFYEEIASRGYLLRTLAQGFRGRRLSPAKALATATVVSSVLFALGHADNPNASVMSTGNIVVAGLMLALPYVLTGRLAASIGLHTTWNLFQSSVYGFPTSGFRTPVAALAVEQVGPPVWTGGEFGPEAGLVGLVAMLLGTALILWRERRRQGRLAFATAIV
jgi:membrane protease YdiL (CAAX protease family)